MALVEGGDPRRPRRWRSWSGWRSPGTCRCRTGSSPTCGPRRCSTAARPRGGVAEPAGRGAGAGGPSCRTRSARRALAMRRSADAAGPSRRWRSRSLAAADPAASGRRPTPRLRSPTRTWSRGPRRAMPARRTIAARLVELGLPDPALAMLAPALVRRRPGGAADRGGGAACAWRDRRGAGRARRRSRAGRRRSCAPARSRSTAL